MVIDKTSRETEQSIGDEQGRRLLMLARATLEQRLGIIDSVDRSGLDDAELNRDGGTFVTLKINKALRGCIGNLEADSSIVESVERNALNAAFNDHRFDPLRVEELEKVSIDVSILSTPVLLHYHNGEDLIDQLRPFIDGVVIRKGVKGATFLPQVWSQLPEPQSFLDHLCQKAGLVQRAWRDEHLDVYTYQVCSFKEEQW